MCEGQNLARALYSWPVDPRKSVLATTTIVSSVLLPFATALRSHTDRGVPKESWMWSDPAILLAILVASFFPKFGCRAACPEAFDESCVTRQRTHLWRSFVRKLISEAWICCPRPIVCRLVTLLAARQGLITDRIHCLTSVRCSQSLATRLSLQPFTHKVGYFKV